MVNVRVLCPKTPISWVWGTAWALGFLKALVIFNMQLGLETSTLGQHVSLGTDTGPDDSLL